MDFRTLLLIFLVLCPASSVQTVKKVELKIDASAKIAWTDANYICATIDWWPKEKCDYNQCPWGSASIINMVTPAKLVVEGICCFSIFKSISIV